MDRSAIMTGGIITFGHLAQSAVETLPPDEQDKMFEGIAVAIASELGNEVTGLSIHRDEAAIHAHFQMPARRPEDGRLMSEVLSPAITSKLQDIAAQIAQSWTPDVERGNAKADTKARNKPVKELHRTAALDLDELVKKRDAAAEKLVKNERLAEKAHLRATENAAEADKALKRARTYERRSEAAREALTQAETELERLRELQDSIRDEVHQLREESQQLAKARDAAIRDAKEDATKIRDKALKSAQEKHRRLMGLAGTSAFEDEPDMEKFNNISRIITDWKVIRQEREALAEERIEFETHRDAVLDRRGKELRQELAETKRHLNVVEGFLSFLKQTLKVMLPEALHQSLIKAVNRDWPSHPQNPDRAPEEPEPSSGPSGPSGP